MRKNPLVGISGNIGVGKTTFAKVISERLAWKVIYESVIDNPYLNDFYNNMNDIEYIEQMLLKIDVVTLYVLFCHNWFMLNVNYVMENDLIAKH